MAFLIGSVCSSCVLAVIASSGGHQQPNEPARSTIGVCRREGAKRVGVQPIEVRGKLGLPRKIKDVRPRYPALPVGTTQEGVGAWIGEVLIDSEGRVANVWTVRQPELTLPAFTDAIIAAIRQWEYEILHLSERGPTPFCRTVTVITPRVK